MRFFQSLTGKLWLAMLVLVLLILTMAALVQSGMLERIYFKQQEGHLMGEGKRLASFIATESDSVLVALEVRRTAEYLKSDLVVINPTGLVEHWHGGMHIRGMMRGRQRPPFSQQDVNRVLEGEVVFMRGFNPYLEQELLSAAIPIRSGKEHAIEGALFISAPLAPLTANVRAMQQAILMTLAGGIVMATLLSLLLSRSLTRPLLEMDQLARRMVAGDYNAKVPVRTGDELGQLAVSLNNLVAELKFKVEQLEYIDQNRREFVDAVSHELRTPLTVIQGYTEAMADGLVKDPVVQERYLGYMQDEIMRLRRLVDELLDVSRIEAGRMDMQTEPLNMAGMAERVLKMFQPAANDVGVTLELVLKDGVPLVPGHPDRLEQVLFNLLGNALRYTPAGGTVTVEVSEGRNGVEISVRDTGPGIPEKEIPLIWERFYKGDKSRTRTDAGSGLGLAIAKKIVELHDGVIDMRNHPEGGSVFTVRLPPLHR